MSVIGWKTGYEIELLAPAGVSRRDLAQLFADQVQDGTVASVFVPQAEISRVEGKPVFENLTLAFDAWRGDGRLIARCADDLTIVADLDANAPPKPGWFRVVGDDSRLLRLIMRHTSPDAPLDVLLAPVADLFGSKLEHFDNGMVRLADPIGAPIAMAAPLPGERERPCEIITPPIESDHYGRLLELLVPAKDLGFTIPKEAALHIHFDAAALCNARAFANLVRIFHRHNALLKRLFRTNTNCVRLGAWPQSLIDIVQQPDFPRLAWPEAVARLSQIKLTKFVDFNVLNIIMAPADKHTFEVRILPVSFDVDLILHQTALIAGLLGVAVRLAEDDVWLLDAEFSDLLSHMSIDETSFAYWREELAGDVGCLGGGTKDFADKSISY